MTAPIVYQETRNARYLRGIPVDEEEFSYWPMPADLVDTTKEFYGNLPGQLWERIAEVSR